MDEVDFEVRKHNFRVGMDYPPRFWDEMIIEDVEKVNKDE